MVMVYCPCGWKGSGFELAALSMGAVVEGDNPNHLVIYVDDKPPKDKNEDAMFCPACHKPFEEIAEWMNKNIPIEMIA